LVNSLYEPNTSEAISQIQEVLQRLQRSPGGWQIAEGLLARPGDNVRFFGALTFIVKLNTESIESGDAQLVLQNLVGWLLKSLENGSGVIVIRKLCSALVTHYIHFSHLWPVCLRDVLYCLHVNSIEALEDGKNSPPAEQIIQALTPQKSVVAIWFATSLAEEVEKTDPKSTKYIGLHERLADNIQYLAPLLAHSFNGQSGSQGQKESMGCFQAWLLYAQRVPSGQLSPSLRPLLQPAIKCLVVDDLYDAAIELVTDTLTNWQAFFTREDFDLMYSLFDSEWSQTRYKALLQGDFDFDSVQFGLLMIAFGDAQIPELMDGSNERAQRFLSGLVGLLTAEGHAVAEDKIFVPALEFWSSLVENLVDEMYTEPRSAQGWSAPPLSYVMQVVSNCWRKIQYPHISVYNSWDSTERVGFGDARKDVADLLQSVYTISGRSLVSLFVDLTLQSLADTAWAELESAAFCLGSLSDCVSDGEECDTILGKIFGSHLFDLLRQSHSMVPVRTRQTCLSLIERYSEYFTRHADYLPAALNLLFSAVSDHPLAGSSSKSIYRLCSSCRSLLISEVDAFLGQYESLREIQTFDSLAEERVVGAIASIVQAIPEEPRRLDAFTRLLIRVGNDVEKAFQLKAFDGAVEPSDPILVRAYDIAQRPTAAVASSEVSVQLAIRALRCLVAVAKGLQSPTESPVDLDAEANGSASLTSPVLEQAQRDIMEILARLKDTFADSGEALVS
jgi:hypothetical protein